jgi:circadian clock protein KaiC
MTDKLDLRLLTTCVPGLDTVLGGQRQRPGLHAFRIGSAGIEIFPRILPAPGLIGAMPPLKEPVDLLSSGVPALDDMFGGGIPSGYSVLLVGPTGSGKTLLATEFLAAGAMSNRNPSCAR